MQWESILECEADVVAFREYRRDERSETEVAAELLEAERNLRKLFKGGTPFYALPEMGLVYASRFHVPHLIANYLDLCYIQENYCNIGGFEEIWDLNAGTYSGSIAAVTAMEECGSAGNIKRIIATEFSVPMYECGQWLLQRRLGRSGLNPAIQNRTITLDRLQGLTEAKSALVLASHPFPFPKDDESSDERVEAEVRGIVNVLSDLDEYVLVCTVNPAEKNGFSKARYLERLEEWLEEDADIWYPSYSANHAAIAGDVAKCMNRVSEMRQQFHSLADPNGQQWASPHLNTNETALVAVRK